MAMLHVFEGNQVRKLHLKLISSLDYSQAMLSYATFMKAYWIQSLPPIFLIHPANEMAG